MMPSRAAGMPNFDPSAAKRRSQAMATAIAPPMQKPKIIATVGLAHSRMAVAIACDLRFAAEGSKFGIPAARLGIIYGGDAVGQLVDLVGPAHAKDILYSARTVGDREALAM